MRTTSGRSVLACSILALALIGCASDESSGDAASPAAEVPESTAPVANACPTDGCAIRILDAVRDGDEIEVTWEANFIPDVSKNHIHIYWDTFTAEQVSSDAEANGVKQGEWVPTDSVPTYVTEGAVSVNERSGSSTICVTAGDRDHAVVDPSIVDCFDVAKLL